MSGRERFRPFTGDAEHKVRLTHAPLALVLCQIRWPELNHLQGDLLSPIAQNFGTALDAYPVISHMQETGYMITPEGFTPQPGDKIYQWHSTDNTWHISLSRRFATLYCTNYTSFADFLERLGSILRALEEHAKILLIERVGVRYVNQVVDSRIIQDISRYVRPEVLGYPGLSGKTGNTRLVSSANQAQYAVDDAALQVRSGLVPPGETVDPAVAPMDGGSWVLDLDASFDGMEVFDVASILAKASRLSDVCYDFFKYVSTENFLKEFGDAT